MNNMLTLEEVKSFLEIDHDQFEKYLKQGKLHAYKIGGTYIRFRKDDVLNLRSELQPKKNKPYAGSSFFSRIKEFWRFNNFYIISLLIVIVVALLIAKT